MLQPTRRPAPFWSAFDAPRPALGGTATYSSATRGQQARSNMRYKYGDAMTHIWQDAAEARRPLPECKLAGRGQLYVAG